MIGILEVGMRLRSTILFVQGCTRMYCLISPKMQIALFILFLLIFLGNRGIFSSVAVRVTSRCLSQNILQLVNVLMISNLYDYTK